MRLKSVSKRNFWLSFTIALATITSVLMVQFSSPSWAIFQDSPKELVDEVWQVVNREYVDNTFNHQDWEQTRKKYLSRDYKTPEAAYKAIREMIKTLDDPYTRFMDPKQYESMQIDTSGELSGVGIQLGQDQKTKQLTVVSPVEDSPAFLAGVKSRDILVAIDGKTTKGMDVDEAVGRIRGKEGSSVTLTFMREKKTLAVPLTRAHIELKSVKSALKVEQGQRIGYVRLTQFSAKADKGVRTAIDKLLQEDAAGFILDLRSNPGGLLYSSTEIARLWMDEGTIVSTVDRNGQRERLVANHQALTDKPLVVLVDGGSASASEILSGALQDNRRAMLVGTKTFGKGLVQSVHPLSDGSGLAVTIARYQTPSGRDINKKGIEPDFKIDLPKKFKFEQVATPQDPQYARAAQILTEKIVAEKSGNVITGTQSEEVPQVSTK